MAQIELTAADGFLFGAYRAMPEGQVKGGVVVIQEIFGVNHHIRAVADGYAAAGYAAIAPQIFDRVERGVELGYTDQQDLDKGIRIAFQDLELADALKDIQAAVDALSESGKVAVVGYCFGGLLAWLSACEVDGVAAASCYYGGGTVKQVDRMPKCQVIMHFGDRDANIPLSDVDIIREVHPGVEIFVYPADHGFNCNERASYDAESAGRALARTLSHFDKHIAA